MATSTELTFASTERRTFWGQQACLILRSREGSAIKILRVRRLRLI
jgi:hypothetical protein